MRAGKKAFGPRAGGLRARPAYIPTEKTRKEKEEEGQGRPGRVRVRGQRRGGPLRRLRRLRRLRQRAKNRVLAPAPPWRPGASCWTRAPWASPSPTATSSAPSGCSTRGGGTRTTWTSCWRCSCPACPAFGARWIRPACPCRSGWRAWRRRRSRYSRGPRRPRRSPCWRRRRGPGGSLWRAGGHRGGCAV